MLFGRGVPKAFSPGRRCQRELTDEGASFRFFSGGPLITAYGGASPQGEAFRLNSAKRDYTSKLTQREATEGA